VILRPYQSETIAKLRALIASGKRKLVAVAPTGAGKTVIASEIIRGAEAKGSRTLFLAHRKELIDQSFAKLEAFGVRAGVIMASDRRRDDYLLAQVASVQTLRNRMDRLPEAKLVIVDECHHSTSQSYRQLIDHYYEAGAVVLGLTATPWPAGRQGLSDIYEDSVLAARMADLMESGSLVRYDAFAYDAPDLHDVKKARGDFDQKALGLACNTEILVGNIVAEYVKHAYGRRAILFPVNVAHSESLVTEFRAAGVAAEHLDCFTPKRERERILAGLASGDVTVVSSVGVLTEGFDCPAADVCILARPTMSLTLFMQMVGRVLRPNHGKIRALIHDHAGNLIRHGFPEDDRDYSLTTTPKRDRELHTCPFCNVVFGALRPDGSCPNCGQLIQEVTERESAGRGTKVVVDGKRLTVDEIRAIREDRADKGMRTDLTDEQLVRVEHASKDARAAEFLRLRDVAIQKNFDRRWPDVQYRNTFGKWPRFDDEYLNTVKPAGAPFVPLPPRKVAA
jgi:DNA repair protein RadD